MRQIEELKATITAQDNTITTLQTQFSSLRASHEAHVSRLVDAHTAEVASLKDYAKVLEEQQSQRTLHHGKLGAGFNFIFISFSNNIVIHFHRLWRRALSRNHFLVSAVGWSRDTAEGAVLALGGDEPPVFTVAPAFGSFPPSESPPRLTSLEYRQRYCRIMFALCFTTKY